MIDISKGRYWDEGVQLIDGCTPCSPGCDHCWSAAIGSRFCKCDSDGNPFFVENGRFTGDIKVWPDRLKRFNTRKPKVFSLWNDLFHKGVSDSFQYEVYRAMILNKQNTYLVLTKRPTIMADFFSPKKCFTLPSFEGIWHGLTVCNQQEADEKIPIFLQVPGKKFLSIEPMLGAMDINNLPSASGYGRHLDALDGGCVGADIPGSIGSVILGGETGAGARPLHPDWVRSIRNQCQSAGVNFFFKQWGEWYPDLKIITRNKQEMIFGNTVVHRVGRNNAGRLLDGREHNDLPWVTK
jgi:protein gp37